MSSLPADACYQDQCGWLNGAGLEVLAEHWPWGRVWPGDLSACEEKEILVQKIAKSKFTSYGDYQADHPAKDRFAELFRDNPHLRDCWVCEVHPLQDDVLQIPFATHHLSYRKLGSETPRDLIKLCKKHHCEVHRLEKMSEGVQSLSWYVAYLRWRVKEERAGTPVHHWPQDPLDEPSTRY
ncbi:hypothetical protein [Gemmatimonas sp.]|uniref:hypothetical protein n=1 Tax=Gemmatimonas sp. TaxID=1962908 RepID=UPI003569D871